MIDVIQVWHHYGVRPILRDVSLHVAPGELMCVMGPNGMGKSTLLGVMAGIQSPIKGHVEISGLKRRGSIEEETQLRQRVVFLPDEPYLPGHHTGREFLIAVGRLYEIGEERLFDHTERLLKLFDLDKLADESISSYSTGQRKKIGLASALVTDAPIFILDEPFSGGLDPSALRALQEVLRHLAEREDVTIVMAAPVPELVETLATRIAIMKDGQIIACDTPYKLCEQSRTSSLSEALQAIVHPNGAENIRAYFDGA